LNIGALRREGEIKTAVTRFPLIGMFCELEILPHRAFPTTFFHAAGLTVSSRTSVVGYRQS
jgi:hypothetical protein